MGIHSVELIVLLLMILVVAFASVAKRLETPYPIILVIGGLLLSLFPHGPHIELDPDIVFLLILPPLLFSAAFVTSWRDFRYNIVSIVMLAFGLVGFTVFGVAAASRWILPGFDWRMGLVLGAVVSTTDAIAATSIGRRLGLSKRIVDILEAESLVNDASGLLALEFATALLVTGRTPSVGESLWRLLYLVGASIVIGLVVGKLIHFVSLKVEDAPIEITISLIAPYFAYLAAEGARTSGVLATVACGLYLGHKSSFYLSTGARLTGHAVWETLTFVLNGFVFLLIGFQLPYILSGIRTHHLGGLLLLGALFSGVVIVLRLIWIYPGAWLSNFIRRRLLAPARTISFFEGGLHHRLDGHARRGSARGSHFSSETAGERGSLPRTQRDDLPYFLRDLRHSRFTGPHAAAANSPPGIGKRGRWKDRRRSSAARHGGGHAGLSRTQPR